MTLDLALLEDFEALATTGHFSRAAARRHVTQPAFSRRIRALEDWAGTPLFRRDAAPIGLTDAGRALRPLVLEALDCLARGREAARGAADLAGRRLRFAATHALSFTFFPAWLRGLEAHHATGAIQLASDSLSACEALLGGDHADFLLCHVHPAAPVRLDPARFTARRLGADRLMRLVAPEPRGGGDDVPLRPTLAYSPASGLGRIVAAARPGEAGAATFTSHLAAALRTMALAGQGAAWLPGSLVTEDLAEGRLVRAGPPGDDIAVDIRLFRPIHPLGAAAEALWAAVEPLP